MRKQLIICTKINTGICTGIGYISSVSGRYQSNAWSPNNICRCTAGGDVHLAPVNSGAVSYPAGGDVHVAPVINGGAVCYPARGDVHEAIGINGGAVCCAARGDEHVALEINSGVVRHPSGVDVQPVDIGFNGGVICHSAGHDVH